MLLQSFTDAESIGCRYDVAEAAADNTAAIKKWISELAHAGRTAALAITGPGDEAQRQAGTLFLDCSEGPAITNPTGADVGFAIAGLPGSALRGINSASAATPVIELTRRGTAILLVQSLRIVSDGSGIKLDRAGSSTVLRDLFIWVTGQGSVRLDDFNDIDLVTQGPDDPVLKCSYGVWVNDADGGILENLQMVGCANHGLVATRWHDGKAHLRTHSCRGIGFKGERVNGCNIDIRCESCFGWGMYLERSGVPGGTGALTAKGIATPGNYINVWFENNNMRVPRVRSLGQRSRQFKLRETSRCQIVGNSGWSKNLADVRQSERLTNVFVDEIYQTPDIPPELDLQLVDDTGRNNFDAAWPDEAHRPELELKTNENGGKEIAIKIKRGSYQEATAAWWLPFNTRRIAADEGDLILWTAEISLDEAGARYTRSREPVEGEPNYFAALGSITINQFGIPLPPAFRRDAQTYVCLWDTVPRKFANHLFRQQTRNDNTAWPLVYLFNPPMDEGPVGAELPPEDFVITFHDLKVYVVPK